MLQNILPHQQVPKDTDKQIKIHGSCHCQNIKYSALIYVPASGAPKARRCNCTVCQKTSITGVYINPSSNFTLISPKSVDEVPKYHYQMKDFARHFCDKCGVHVWVHGYYEIEGTRYETFSINLSTVDQPQDGIDLSEWRFEYVDGLKNNFMAGLKDVPYSGGTM